MTKTVSNKAGKVLRCALAAATAVAFTPAVAFADSIGDPEDTSSVLESSQQDDAEVTVVATWDMTPTTVQDGSALATLYSDGRLVFSGTGEMRGYSNVHDTPWLDDTVQSETGVSYHDSIKSVVFEDGVQPTTLMCYFQNCANLTYINRIPDTVKSLYATFSGCTSLKEVPAIPGSVTDMSYAFQNCTAMETAPDIPSSVTNMSYAFQNCTALTTAKVSAGVTSMFHAFEGCTALETAPEIPSSINSTSSSGGLCYAFKDCTSLKNVQDVITLYGGEGAISTNFLYIDRIFYGCTALETAPQFVLYNYGTENETYVGKTTLTYAFYGCSSLKNVPSLPDRVNLNCAFYGCTSLSRLPQIAGGYRYDWYTDEDGVGHGSNNTASAFADCASLLSLPEGFKMIKTYKSGMFKMSSGDSLPMVLPASPEDAVPDAYNWAADNRTAITHEAFVVQLNEKIAEAEGLTSGVQFSIDGTDVYVGEKWWPQFVADAIAKAKAATVDDYPEYAALTTLTEAIEAIKNAEPAEGTRAADEAANQLALSANMAYAATIGVKTSTDGKDVYVGTMWVTEDMANALTTAIEEARAAATTDVEKSQYPQAAEVTAKSEALTAALAAYKPAEGTKALPSSGGGASSGGGSSTTPSTPTTTEPSAEDKTAATTASSAIDAIGTVTLDSKAAIEAARAAYNALTAEQKELVPVEKLVNLAVAEATYAILASQGTTDPTPVDPTPVDPVVESVTVGGVTYAVSDSGVAVTKIAKSAKTVTVPTSVSVNGKTYKVTAVPVKAFEGCTKLTSVTIGKNVKTIGASAFKGCTKLKTVTIKSTKLTKASVKNALKSSKVTTVKVPASKLAAYKKIFTKANCGKTVKVVKA